MTPVDAQMQITVTLAAEAWNQVLFVMGESPVAYRVSAPLIQGIGQQLQAAAQGAGESATAPNGQDRPQYVPAA